MTKNHHCFVKSLTLDTMNTLFDRRNVYFHLKFSYAKVERELTRLRKKNSSFPDNLMEELEKNCLVPHKRGRDQASFLTADSQPTTKSERGMERLGVSRVSHLFSKIPFSSFPLDIRGKDRQLSRIKTY